MSEGKDIGTRKRFERCFFFNFSVIFSLVLVFVESYDVNKSLYQPFSKRKVSKG